MKNNYKTLLFVLSAFSGSLLSFETFADQAPNPRSASTNVINMASQRSLGNEVQRGSFVASGSDFQNVSRTATNRPTNVVSRSGITPVTSSSEQFGRNEGSVNRSGTTISSDRVNVTNARSGIVTLPAVSRSGASVARSSTTNNSKVINASRAASSRATAIFSDVSKIGGGYAECREAYATCMDQFCANANDTYRRCFCSNKFIEFRDMEAAFDEVKTLLMQFEDNNLNAVDKTAAEVNAMYTATVGEQAIKNDTSGAAKILSEIGDLLSGNKKPSSSTTSLSDAISNMNFDFTVDMDDIWSGGTSSNIFASGNGVNLSELEGSSLFNEANRQCLRLISDSCENDAVLTMAKSAYNILITQDCNIYEKNINAQKESIEQTVRTAEKYLMEARLEEYRSHNSADVNECIGKVRTALMEDTACGENYKRCLDYSGVYINMNTGEPIYSPRLFQLANLITLDGNSDVLSQNKDFNTFLDSKKMFAASGLDTCRDISDIVWEEFKRAALIEIAQAQDAKIEEVKSSCVSTMAECYDTQSNAIKSFDSNTAKSVGALSALAARDMCADKVSACASLYGGTETCTFDGNGKLTSDSKYCGLSSFISYVNSVDTIRVAEECETGISNFLQELCTEDGKYPWGCRTMKIGSPSDGLGEDNKITDTLWAQINFRKGIYCGDLSAKTSGLDNVSTLADSNMQSLVIGVTSELGNMLGEECESLGGIWYSSQNGADNTGQSLQKEEKFYNTLFNGSSESSYAQNSFSYGWCVQNSIKYNCDLQNEAMGSTSYTTFDAASNRCVFSEDWYKTHCEYIDGMWKDGVCYR